MLTLTARAKKILIAYFFIIIFAATVISTSLFLRNRQNTKTEANVNPTPTTFDLQETSITDNMNLSIAQRSVGRITNVSASTIELTLPNGGQELFLIKESTQYIKRVTAQVTPDTEGFRPQIEQIITLGDLKINDQVEIYWQKTGEDFSALLVILL